MMNMFIVTSGTIFVILIAYVLFLFLSYRKGNQKSSKKK